MSSNLDTWIAKEVREQDTLFIPHQQEGEQLINQIITIFTYEGTTNVRTTTKDETPLFCANDVAAHRPAGKIRPQLLVTPTGQSYFAGILNA